MSLHFGKTKYPGVIRFHRGTIMAKGYKDQECYHQHPINWWLGFSWAGKWFFGIIRTGPTEDARH